MAIEIAKDIHAEQQAIASMIMDAEAAIIGLDVLDSGDFYDPRFSLMFTAIKGLNEDFVQVDPQSLVTKLKALDTLQAAGGIPFVVETCQSVSTSANIRLFADTVKRRSLARKLMAMTFSYYQSSAKEHADGKDLFERLSKDLSELLIELPKSSLKHVSEICAESIEEIENYIMKKQSSGIHTGYRDLDYYLCGLKPGTMMILAARPSVGKTALALNIANNAAIAGTTTAYFSLEMSSSQLITRLICKEAEINMSMLKRGCYAGSIMSGVVNKGAEIAKRIMWFDDSATNKITSIYSRCARLRAEAGLGLVVIDYLGLIDTPYIKGRSREQEVAYLSKSIKGMARELGVPVMALSQLSRNSEHGEGRAPKLSDLRDSGSLEQDSDVVVFLHTKDKTTPEITVSVAKNRNGATGELQMHFDREYQRFGDIAKQDEPVGKSDYFGGYDE